MKFNKVKDSGQREDMSTGSRRDSQVGKSRPDLMNPLVLRRLGMHFANGCDKYGEKNFELGQKTSRYRASLGRHLLDYDEGLVDEDHLSAIIWNAMGIMLNQELIERGIYDRELDDRSDYTDHEGFWTTVGDRAMKFNESLRRKDGQVTIQPLQITHEEMDEDLETCPSVPPCFECTEDEDLECPCNDEDICGTHPCKECDLVDQCPTGFLLPYYQSKTIEAIPVEVTPHQCSTCLDMCRGFTEAPCRTCIRYELTEAIVPQDNWRPKS